MPEADRRPAPLILSAVLDAPVQQRLDALRRAHFPPERNHLDAHVTLFHHLPGAECDAVEKAVEAMVRGRPAPTVDVTGVRSLGRGVAISLASPELAAIRTELARGWAPWLTPQDRAKRDLHVTVQNKVTPAEARAAARRAGRHVRPGAHAGGRARAVALPRRPLGTRRPVPVRRGRTRARTRFGERDVRIPARGLRHRPRELTMTTHTEPPSPPSRGPPSSTSPNGRASRSTSTAGWPGSRSTA